MRRFRDWALRAKLTALLLITSLAALTIASIAFVTYETVSYRQGVILDMRSSAEIIAINCTAALSFHDSEAGGDVLSALRIKHNVIDADLHSADGRVLSSWSRDGTSNHPEIPAATGQDEYAFYGNMLSLVEPVVLDQEVLGSVHILEAASASTA